MAKLGFKNGQTSIIIRVRIPDTTSVIGAGKTGLTFSSTGLIISTIADNEASPTTYTTAGSTIETITTLGTFAAPTATKCRFKEVDATNHPGLYEIQIADARWAVSNARSLIVTLPPVSGLGTGPVSAEIQLTAIDPQDAVRFGMTSLPNAAAEASGGLFTRGTGAGQINQDANGRINVNLLAILGTTLTETAGQIAAGLKQFFNIASPTSTMNLITAVTTTTTATNLTTNNDKTGYGLSTAAVQAVWDALTSALTTTGSIGKWIVDKIDIVLSTRLASGSYTAPSNSDITAIKTQTDKFNFTGTDVKATLDSETVVLTDGSLSAAKFATDAIDANAIKSDAVTEFQSGLATSSALSTAQSGISAIAGYVDTEVAAIKAKTDLIPASPAAVGDIPTSAANASATWNEALAGHSTTGTAGKILSAISSSEGGDSPGVTTLLARTAAAVTVTSPINPTSGTITLVQGDSYDSSDVNRPLMFTSSDDSWPDLSDADIHLYIFRKGVLTPVIDADATFNDSPVSVTADVTGTQTAALRKSTNAYDYRLVAVMGDLSVQTLALGVVNIIDQT